jgi:glycosyltransferase involved in cell wall biosynthesis
MTKKNIWIISHYTSPIKYGYGTRLFLLSEEFIKMGYDVTIFTSTSNYQLNIKPVTKKIFTKENINGITLVWVKGINYSDVGGFKRVLSWFIFSLFLLFYRSEQTNKPDIVLVSSLSIIPVINGWLITKRYSNCKFILEIRDLWPQTLIEIGGYSIHHPLVILLGWFEKFGYKHADHIVATMPKADIHIRKRIKQEFNFTCIPQGIDLNLLNGNTNLTEEEIKEFFLEKKFVVGYAGALGRANSLETLIETARHINKRLINDIHFILVGDGNAKQDLMKLAKGLKNVSFMPRIPKIKVQGFLQNCDLLYASAKQVPLYNYGISLNKLMDYMLSAKPIVFAFSGYDSLISESGCGSVIPAGDAAKLEDAILTYYYMDKDEREKTGRKGRDYIMNHRTFNVLAGQYQYIFQSLCKKVGNY